MIKLSITLKIDQKLLDEVKIIAEHKFPLRNITSYAEATREALIEFVKKNQKFSKPLENSISKAMEESS